MAIEPVHCGVSSILKVRFLGHHAAANAFQCAFFSTHSKWCHYNVDQCILILGCQDCCKHQLLILWQVSFVSDVICIVPWHLALDNNGQWGSHLFPIRSFSREYYHHPHPHCHHPQRLTWQVTVVVGQRGRPLPNLIRPASKCLPAWSLQFPIQNWCPA